MSALEAYQRSDTLPGTESGGVGLLLGLNGERPVSDMELAGRIEGGLDVDAVEALGKVLGRKKVIGPVVSASSVRRARKDRKPLSTYMSNRIYNVARVVDAASRTHRGDESQITRFLGRPHALLEGKTPIDMARSSPAGAEAVVNLLRRAEAGIHV